MSEVARKLYVIKFIKYTWKNIFGGFIFGLFLAYRARRTVGGLQQTGGLSAAYSKWSFSGLQQIWPLDGLQGEKSEKKELGQNLAYRV